MKKVVAQFIACVVSVIVLFCCYFGLVFGTCYFAKAGINAANDHYHVHVTRTVTTRESVNDYEFA